MSGAALTVALWGSGFFVGAGFVALMVDRIERRPLAGSIVVMLASGILLLFLAVQP